MKNIILMLLMFTLSFKPILAIDSNKIQLSKDVKILFDAEFMNTCFFELYVDGKLAKKGFLKAGDREIWEAKEIIQFRAGNAGGLKVKINGKEYTFGKNGQIAAKIITYQKDMKDPNKYRILIKEWR